MVKYRYLFVLIALLMLGGCATEPVTTDNSSDTTDSNTDAVDGKISIKELNESDQIMIQNMKIELGNITTRLEFLDSFMTEALGTDCLVDSSGIDGVSVEENGTIGIYYGLTYITCAKLNTTFAKYDIEYVTLLDRANELIQHLEPFEDVD